MIYVSDRDQPLKYNSLGHYGTKYHGIRSRPDVELRVGGNGPIVGFAKFRVSRNLTLGFGRPPNKSAEDGAVLCEKMRNVCWWGGHRRYRVKMAVKDAYKPSGSGSDTQRRVFEWRRTRSEAYGAPGAGNATNYQYTIIDVKSGEVVAIYLDNLSGKKGEEISFDDTENEKGKLMLFRGEREMGQNWKIMLLLGSCGLIEKRARRARFNYFGHFFACAECLGHAFTPRCGGSF